MVGALGAITRLISPLIKNKEDDPAVLVLDSKALKIVPLLGAHKGGAEELALQLAEDLGGDAVITGDARSCDRLCVDSFGEGWGWRRSGDRNAWQNLMQQLARGACLEIEQHSGSKLWQSTEAANISLKGIPEGFSLNSVQLKISSQQSADCCWHPATLWIGVGCERNTSQTLIESSLQQALSDAGLAEEAIAGLASIDRKSDEVALLTVARERGWPIRFFSAKDLADVSVPNPSEVVNEEVGTASVSEAAALLAAGEGGILLREKHIYKSIIEEKGALTISIAEASKPFSPNRGELHLVGSGPGDLAFLTNDARFALSRSVVWVGYGLYLDLLEPLRRPDQVCISGQLTKEEERCSQALALASQGARVSLISSGDIGIYGMGGLALELWLAKPEHERPQLEIHPGVSAMQIVASRVGAPLMNDFCAVSLSDRLTPWSKIEERLIGAVKGDFVIGLYNPQSRDRDWQLKFAVELFLKYRSPETPVVLARQVGRADESVTIHSLGNLPIEAVDMLTLVLVGNSQSLVNDGWVINPRGYFSK